MFYYTRSPPPIGPGPYPNPHAWQRLGTVKRWRLAEVTRPPRLGQTEVELQIFICSHCSRNIICFGSSLSMASVCILNRLRSQSKIVHVMSWHADCQIFPWFQNTRNQNFATSRPSRNCIKHEFQMQHSNSGTFRHLSVEEPALVDPTQTQTKLVLLHSWSPRSC